MPVPMSEQKYYLIGDEKYEPVKPSGRQNLTELFGLQELATTVARVDPATNTKRKLRKSYKNQIADLAGKHAIPNSAAGTGYSLLDQARQPPRYDPSKPIPPLGPPIDQKTLSSALSLDKTPATGLPDFDISLLASPNNIQQQLQAQESQQQQSGHQSGGGGSGMNRSGSLKNFRNGIALGNATGESSQDDSTGTRRLLKKKKRRDNSDPEDVKRRKMNGL